MTDQLPNGKEAILDVRKIADYCLSPSHPRGRHKARVFRDVLGLGPDDVEWLRLALLDAARDGEATFAGKNDWGTQWRVDALVRRHGREAVLRSLWIVGSGDDVPRFVSCWIR